ncbi:unnamed protein product [Ascophyllum nodosum]
MGVASQNSTLMRPKEVSHHRVVSWNLSHLNQVSLRTSCFDQLIRELLTCHCLDGSSVHFLQSYFSVCAETFFLAYPVFSAKQFLFLGQAVHRSCCSKARFC